MEKPVERHLAAKGYGGAQGMEIGPSQIPAQGKVVGYQAQRTSLETKE